MQAFKSLDLTEIIWMMLLMAGLKINNAIIRYSNVGKADSCDELWNGCDEITGQLKNQSQVHGVVDVRTL